MFSKIKNKIKNSPLFKTIIGVSSLIIAGILSNTFVAEITIDSEIHLNLFYKTKSFYFLLIFIVLIYFYYRFLWSIDKSTADFKDDEYCKAYMRKECLPQYAKKINELIKSGKDANEVRNIIKKSEILK